MAITRQNELTEGQPNVHILERHESIEFPLCFIVDRSRTTINGRAIRLIAHIALKAVEIASNKA